MDHTEIWNEAIQKAKQNPALAGYIPILEGQRDVMYPQGERAVQNWLEWVEAQA